MNDTTKLYLGHGQQVRMHSGRALRDIGPVVLVEPRVALGTSGLRQACCWFAGIRDQFKEERHAGVNDTMKLP